ncbi:xanthine dehydrogenase family protein molybdopterin-binding subunit (plasmid) [Natrinema zhouii]|uniref:xanthine dehydrogenase family protein molybdopterin-binding subunit n=1 Tax=Natrinema zhouii TaxID=1710539 RepID=UPI001CFFD8EF|nr:xanthine dehydrogenase family protein molybdopterin-binding subunit [Natrinema zhouii]UHQ98442.1 xanthine dehydrogenase family protein molybdopterin-binding subunit [Natrinema zhouii]
MSTSHPAETDADTESDSSRESFTGQGLPRVEDHRILTGEAEYIHDITPENCLHMVLVRSMHAHAEIASIDTEEAEAHPDCELVLTAEDIKAEYNPMPTGVGRIATGEKGEPVALPEWALADEKVRFVGEPVVAVVASDRYAAEDIADLVDVTYETMDAVADGMAAREDEVVLHESVGSNVVDNEHIEFGDPDAAFEDADHVVESEYSWGRISGVPLETAGAVATYDEESDSFDIDCNIQLHTLVDNMIYETLGYEADDVRVNVPADVGGSYGTKIGIHRYCCLTSMASQQLERPVKFEEDRLENLQGGDMHSSDREYQMRMAVDDDGTMRGLDVWFVDDFGAYPRYPINQVLKPLSVLTNSYEIDDVSYEYDLVLTNKTSQTAYRGFGVDPHIYALEMIVDEAARTLDMDPTEFRRRNLIRPEQMPYTLPSKNLYDSGDYPATLDRIEEIIEDERDGGLLDPDVVAAKREEGKYRGVQPSVIIEPGASGSDWTDRQRTDPDDLAERSRDEVEELPEHLRAEIREDGSVHAFLATDSSGQGHQTLVSQLLADELEVLPSDIEVGYLDSVDAPTEYGSAASRMAVMLSGATIGVAERLLANVEELAADHWDVSTDNVSYHDGTVDRLGGDDSLSLAEIAELDAETNAAGERRTRVSYNYDHPATDLEEFDEALTQKLPVYPTAAFGANAPIVEVDVKTGQVEILKFHTVRDCGTMLNPMIVEGQAHGGIAQGIGAALLEEFGYEDDGQPQAITLFDYLLPSIENVPEIEMEHTETPSPFTASGAKGVGEGGMIDAPASIATSINAALDPLSVEEPASQIPVAPDHLRRKLRDSEQ